MIRAALAAILLTSPAATAGDLAFVTSQNGNAVSVIDLSDHRVIATTTIEGAPAPVAYDAAAGRAYVVAADTGRLTVLSEAGEITGSRELGEGAFGIAVAPGGGVFVADWYGARLIRLDADLAQMWQAKTGAAPAGVAVSTDGTLVATADRDADGVSIFDAETGERLRQVGTAGPHPFGITWHEGRIWTADVQGNSVSVIDPAAGAVIGSVPSGSHPYAVAFAGGRGFVTDQYGSTVTVFDPASLQVIGTVATGDYPEGIAALPDGSGVVVANWDSDTVQIIDAETLAITAEIDLPAGPRAFGQFTGRQVQP
ncbi:YncE family protein [Paracoccus sp. M683]|uniref:YncE family protein n=1 Tax=Paracoccus sp. M683 TaxID=2594268 RepID=UPI00117D83AF|nr:YncE family protein [Paracoccus sp. M683]TRW98765.1 YncE family protein [Paracoccus sp. M683]